MFDLNFGGRLKADASYDDSNAYPGDYIIYVNPEDGTNPNNNDEFNMTAKETRLWLEVLGPKADWVKTSGKVEIDFFGSTGAANKGNVLLRHAFMTFDFPNLDLSFLAGQTWDNLSPLVCYTLNYTVGWDQGNIGYRRPQMRLTKTLRIDEVEFVGAAAIARTIDADGFTIAGQENGEGTGQPTVQGRLGCTTPFLFDEKVTFGVSGHFGVEELTVTTPAPREGTFQTWSFNVDLKVPVTKYVTLSGEYFLGENLDTYFGGIGQGVDTTLWTEIRSEGGWVQAQVKPIEGWEWTVGYGVDDPRDADLSAGKRSRNDFIFTNIRYALLKTVVLALEYGHYTTEYRDASSTANDNRVQFSTILAF
jgi:hypothetical protein